MKNYLDIEKKYDLYHIEIDGLKIWQYFRTAIWYEIQRGEKFSGEKEDPVLRKQEKFKIYLKKFAYIFTHKNWKRIHKADILFLNFGRRIKKDGVYVDKFTGELEKYFCDKFVVIEYNRNYSLPLRPTQSQKEYYPEWLECMALIKTKIETFFKVTEYKNVRQEVERYFAAPLEEIQKKYDIQIDLTSYFNRMTKEILNIKRFKRSYSRLLNKVKPKIIVEAIYDVRLFMIINEIAKKMGIPTVELQHGMPINNILWNYADACGMIPQFPDYVFGYSDYFNSFMTPPISKANVKAVGLPYLEQSLLANPKCKVDNRVTILFVSQRPVAKQLSKLAVEIREMLGVDQYRIIYKLHPREASGWREDMPWLCNKGIEVIDDRSYETYKCYAQSDIQIGVYSTAIFEGLIYNLDTYIYKVGLWEIMNDIVELGYAEFITDCNDFIDKLNSGTNIKKQIRGVFWKENAISNMLQEIEKISGIKGNKLSWE